METERSGGADARGTGEADPLAFPADRAAAGKITRSELRSDGTWLYWAESRPGEGGRQVIVRGRPGGELQDVTPPGISVRSRVHEYGGGVFCLWPPPYWSGGVGADDRPPPAGGAPSPPGGLVYVDQEDQRVYMVDLVGGTPRPISPPSPVGERWAHGDLEVTADGRSVVCVRERHRSAGPVDRCLMAYEVGTADPAEPPRGRRDPTAASGPVEPAPGPADQPGSRGGVGADTEQGGPSVLFDGSDFVSSPRVDRSGTALAWITWDHPAMPWDDSRLWVATLGRDGSGALSLGEPRAVAGDAGSSVGQPVWLTGGRLLFCWDREGWWQPWVEGGGRLVRLCAAEREFHGPAWQLGMSTWAELAPGQLACRSREDGRDRLSVLDTASGMLRDVSTGYPGAGCVTISSLCSHGGGVAWLGASPSAAGTLWWCPAPVPAPDTTPHPGPPAGLITVPTGADPAGRQVAVGESFRCRGPAGEVWADVFSPLRRPASRGSGGDGGPPPLVVLCHGGPTGSAELGFDPLIHFLTTRGLAVAAVDYSGSAGRGRDYRRRLDGRWGELDSDDCVAVARALADQGRVDGARMAIRGGSAGGLTALNALVRSEVFRAAVSLYGVSDLLTLAAATHDFESHYLDSLVGPLPASEAEYRRRSPARRADEISGAVLVFQGLDDPVVPPDQSESLVAALRARGVPCRYLTFEGEGHGFRRADTLVACLEAEHAFYQEHLSP